MSWIMGLSLLSYVSGRKSNKGSSPPRDRTLGGQGGLGCGSVVRRLVVCSAPGRVLVSRFVATTGEAISRESHG